MIHEISNKWLNSTKCRKKSGSTQQNVGKSGFWGTVRMDSGWLRVARGGSGAKRLPRAQKLEFLRGV